MHVNILIFGATGMVGQGVLRECLLADDVNKVLAVGRKTTGLDDGKLEEIILESLLDLSGVEQRITGFDACFFCLGVSSGGMSEENYTRLTHDLTIAIATTVLRLNPGIVFTYVSGAGTDSTESGRSMWARVKGKTENELQKLPFAGVYLFRPGIIAPLNGIQSQTRSYRIIYTILKPLLPVMRKLLPNTVLTTEVVGKAMLAVARKGRGRHVLEIKDINAMASAGS
jgi:uncharacterized protein YbjT (DUF2867 family)